jgi:hypothetical protein
MSDFELSIIFELGGHGSAIPEIISIQPRIVETKATGRYLAESA